MSHQSYLKNAMAASKAGKKVEDIQPALQRRLGVGLAALLAKRRLDVATGESQATPQTDKGKKLEGVELLSDDDSFYGEEDEDELGVKSALRRKKMEQGQRPPKAKNSTQGDNEEAAK